MSAEPTREQVDAILDAATNSMFGEVFVGDEVPYRSVRRAVAHAMAAGLETYDRPLADALRAEAMRGAR